MKNHEAHLELQNIECHMRNLVSEAELEAAGATHAPGRPPHIRVMRLISHLKERAELAESLLTVARADIERLKAISDAAFHVVMQWGAGTEESTRAAIVALEGLFNPESSLTECRAAIERLKER